MASKYFRAMFSHDPSVSALTLPTTFVCTRLHPHADAGLNTITVTASTVKLLFDLLHASSDTHRRRMDGGADGGSSRVSDGIDM